MGKTAQVGREEMPGKCFSFSPPPAPISQSDRLRCGEVGKGADCTELNITNNITLKIGSKRKRQNGFNKGDFVPISIELFPGKGRRTAAGLLGITSVPMEAAVRSAHPWHGMGTPGTACAGHQHPESGETEQRVVLRAGGTSSSQL